MKETFYFSHDYNARNDEKILELRAEFGAEGYGVFWMLVESMAESSEGYLNRGAMGGLSLGYGVAKDTLCKIVDFCINVGLFLMKDDTYFYSKRLQEHKDLRKMLSEKGKQGAIKMWERKKQEQILEEKKDEPKGDANGGAIGDADAKKRKGKKKKLNIKDLASDFLEFWNIYDKKEDLAKCYEKWQLLDESEKDAIKKHAPIYVKNKPDKTYRKNPLTYLNQKTFLDEIQEISSHFETQSKKIIPKQPIVNAGNVYFNEDGSMK